MIFLDTETTDLLKPDAANLEEQPHMTEFFGVRLDEDFQLVSKFHSLFSIPVPVPEKITRITGITDDMLKGQPTFRQKYDELVAFFLGETTVVGHNVSFDMGVLRHELRRLEKQWQFPWPPNWICTIEKTTHLRGRRLKLGELHNLATGAPHEGAHRAQEDVAALVRCYIWMQEEGIV